MTMRKILTNHGKTQISFGWFVVWLVCGFHVKTLLEIKDFLRTEHLQKQGRVPMVAVLRLGKHGETPGA